ncbi:MAG TPA: ParB/RepB/Spo0J family partition protein [Clostridiales bacterium]|nr:ParB/RepB/Spo0J family partition protein [Clostridiales bacterium]
MAKKRMGKGLGALIPTDIEDSILNEASAKKEKNEDSGVKQVGVDKIRAALKQARSVFDDEKLHELTASIQEHGVIQPLLVRETAQGFELIAGERRLRAAKAAGLNEVPVIIARADDDKAAEMGLIENIQREDLNAMEEAAAYAKMMEEYHYTQESLAQTLGKSRSYIANTLRLLALDQKTRNLIREGKISAGHGRALLSVKAEPRKEQLLKRIIKENLSVRQAEDAAKALNEARPQGKQRLLYGGNTYYREMENKLREHFQTKIRISGSPAGGKIELSYGSDEELTRLLELMIEEENA